MKHRQPSFALKHALTAFDELFNDFGRGIPPTTPKADLEFELAFAGLTKDDLALNANGNQLTISVTKKELTGYKKSFENFKRTYLVDPDYDLGRVEAKMDNGLLYLKIPLREEAKKKEFQIAVN